LFGRVSTVSGITNLPTISNKTLIIFVFPQLYKTPLSYSYDALSPENSIIKSLLQPSNASTAMLVTLSGIIILVSFLQSIKAALFIVFTVSGTVKTPSVAGGTHSKVSFELLE